MAHKDKRNELIEVASNVFLRYGYRKTTLDDIAEAAGMQKSSLYHYFDNRDDLFRAVVNQIHADLFDKIQDVLTGTRPFKRELKEFVEVLSKEVNRLQPNIEYVVEDFGHIIPITRDLISDFLDRLNAFISDRVRKAIEDGELKPCPVEDLVLIMSVFLQRVLKAREFSTQHSLAADNALHYVLVLFEPYFTKTPSPDIAS